MTNRQKYFFDDFTIENYRSMVACAISNGFSFRCFSDAENHGFDWNKKNILWRHDVEFSPYVALEMAKIEAELGVKATYFCQLHSEFYNLFERAVSDVIVEISALGHEIGLHFDSHYWGLPSVKLTDEENLVNLNSCIERDAAYLSAALGLSLRSFSFHCTDSFVMRCEDLKYGGLVNAYSRFFKSNFAYCSDSTGIWRFERLTERLLDPECRQLQVLTHDAMWSREILSPRKRVFAAIEDRAVRTKLYYDEALKHYGAHNIDD